MTANRSRGVPRQVSARVLSLVAEHPGQRAAELSAVCGSVLLRAWLPTALLDLRDTCSVRVDDDGAYWPTTP